MLQTRNLVAWVAGASLLVAGAQVSARMSPREIYKSQAPGVVLIVASQEGSSSASAGTGSIISADGMVITNSHVVYDANAKAAYPVIHVFLKPDKVTGDMNKDLSRHFVGELVAHDPGLDLALLKMKSAPAGLAVITLGDPEELGPGDETIAIGHPEQGGLWTITKGVIGAEFENFKGIAGKHVFQMDTSLNRGNSGGPLFDVRGYQIGVNTAIARKGAGGVAITGVNFAVKSSVVKTWTAKYNLALAYGGEPLAGDTRVAVADAQPARPTQPATPVTQPARQPDPDPGRTYKDPGGRGTLTVEDGDEGEEYVPEPVHRKPPAVGSKPTEQVAKRTPLRFEKGYRLPPRPYTYKRLFTAVEKVRARADESFDDLEREIRKRRAR